jgi:hypothetical protein
MEKLIVGMTEPIISDGISKRDICRRLKEIMSTSSIYANDLVAIRFVEKLEALQRC